MSKKVAFCIPYMIIGGVETVFCSTIDEISKNDDLEIRIITHAAIQEPFYQEWLKTHPDIPVYVIYPLHNWFESLQPYCRFFPLKQLRKIIFSLYKKYRRIFVKLSGKFKDIDIFVDYKQYDFFKELRYFKQPKITWLHAALSYYDPKTIKHRSPLYSKIIVITKECANVAKKTYPEYANKFVHIYNPLNVSLIQQKADNAETPKGRYFCHVSRLCPGKDIKTVLKAFDQFAVEHKNISMLIVGDGEDMRKLKTYADGLKSHKRIIFTGMMPNPFGIMKGAIANILSSEKEGFGMVAIESMALQVPTILSNYDFGAREILDNGRNGWLFNVGDANKLEQCMTDVLDHPEKNKKLVKHAYASLNRFNVKNIGKQIVELLINE